ncbi:hypothetical protein D8I35_01565 [Corticibacter populi]|uniref:Uncharacterized protein n=1 Tax=Corticibacter populi TaxID=1550736 RepID=A0A3M6QZ83_9BURK|nr:hypothetical protein [Corticibacter populi]RMX07842.1 hypothetical protein D8I35_01565 [Corticibacter populi]
MKIKGNIGKTKLNQAMVVKTNTFDQRLMISDVVANGGQYGVKTESLVHNVLERDGGFTILPGTKY